MVYYLTKRGGHMYTSTRCKLNLNATECILKGISDDGGLFIVNDFNDFNFNFHQTTSADIATFL